MRLAICLLFELTARIFSMGQEQVLTLSQLIDSAVSNQMNLKIGRLESRQRFNELSQQIYSPTELSFRGGYLYSVEKEQEWHIRQEFASPFRLLDKDKMEKGLLAKSTADSMLGVKLFIADLKKSYFLCVYRLALYKHYQMVLDMLDRTFRILSDSVGSEAEKIYWQWVLKAHDSYYDWLDAQNELRYMAGLYGMPIPADTILELYAIEPVPDTLTRTPARLFYRAYLSQVQYNTICDQWQKHARWPSLFFDLSLRNNPSRQNLISWQVGLRVPLSSFSQQDSKKFVQEKITEYTWQKQKAEIDYKSEKLIIQMNKRFAQVNYYRDRIIPQIEKETYRTLNEVFDHELAIADHIHNFLSWQTYYVDYLTAIYEYNILAADLEVLAY